MIKRLSRALCAAVVCFAAGHLTGCSTTLTTGNTSTSPAVIVTTASLPAGLQGRAYSATLAVTGGTSPYTFTVSQGLIPAGFVMTASGVLSGTPTKAGTYS